MYMFHLCLFKCLLNPRNNAITSYKYAFYFDSFSQEYDDIQVVVLQKEIGVGLGFSLAGGADQNKPITVRKYYFLLSLDNNTTIKLVTAFVSPGFLLRFTRCFLQVLQPRRAP